MPANLLTIDFEEWYQGLTSTSVQSERWSTFESRIEQQAELLLDMLDRHAVTATFFVVGEIARTHPGILREIARRGHEIGLHGDMHRRVDAMTKAEFAADLARNFDAVAHATGTGIAGYRAAYASLGRDTEWFFACLAAQGLDYDSSVFPVRTPLYGLPGATPTPSLIETAPASLVEIPISTATIAGKRVPFSGGFWFRQLPYAVVRRITQAKNAAGEPVIFYFHPWEFDPSHPRPDCTTAREHLSHYSRLRGAREKFCRLLGDFGFEPMGRYATSLRRRWRSSSTRGNASPALQRS